MPAAIDLTGEKYGRLTALSLVRDRAKGPRKWLFLCDCGTKLTLNPAYVRSGTTRSCGCLRRETTAKNRFRDFTGKKIGRLSVIKLSDARQSHNRISWDCICACGKIAALSSHALGKKNPTLSCGCLRREMTAALGRSGKQDNPISKTSEYKMAVKRKRRERPEVAIAESISRMLCLALHNVNSVKNGRTFEILGYSPLELKTHLEKQFKQGMSWDNRGEWEIDHIVPISTASNKDEVLSLNQLSNLRPLWSKENNAKRDKRSFLI